MLQYFEQQIPGSRLLGKRLGIFFGNLFRRGSTTLLVTT